MTQDALLMPWVSPILRQVMVCGLAMGGILSINVDAEPTTKLYAAYEASPVANVLLAVAILISSLFSVRQVLSK